MITKERKMELLDQWETQKWEELREDVDEEVSAAWRLELTQEERELVEGWDTAEGHPWRLLWERDNEMRRRCGVMELPYRTWTLLKVGVVPAI